MRFRVAAENFFRFMCGGFRRGGGLSGATGEHGPEFGDLIVNPALLRITFNFCRGVPSEHFWGIPFAGTGGEGPSCRSLFPP